MYPRGWFVVAMSSEVTTDSQLDARYFEQSLCLRRDADGTARADGWETRERNGLVFVSYPAGDALPSYEIPSLDEDDLGPWEPWTMSRMRIATQSREVVENVADKAHFLPVHGTRFDSFETEFNGHMAIQRTTGSGSDDHRANRASHC